MDLYSVLFPSPSFKDEYKNHSKNVVFIPKPDSNTIDDYIPTLLLKPLLNTNNFLIIFHSNAEDIFSVYSLAEEIKISLNVNIIFS